jgi:phage-related protein
VKNLKMYAVVAAMALVVPAGAIAKKPESKPHKGKTPKVKLATANVKGDVTANDGASMTVTVVKASGHAKACKGQSLTFDVSKARFHVADNDADGDTDAADVLVGHAVKVQGKVAITKGRKTACAVAEGQVLPARQVHDRTTPQVDDGDDAEETEDADEAETETDES